MVPSPSGHPPGYLAHDAPDPNAPTVALARTSGNYMTYPLLSTQLPFGPGAGRREGPIIFGGMRVVG